jgi:hypothetical protein
VRHRAGNARPANLARAATSRPIAPPLAPIDPDDIVRTPVPAPAPAHVIAPGPHEKSVAPPAGAVTAPTELRRAARVRRKSRAQLLLYPAGRHPHPIDVTIVDYSATGIGIIHSEGLLVGQKFIVREPHVTEGKTCLYTVVRSEARTDGSFSIGMHIGNSLANEHDKMLAIPPAPGITLGSKLLFLVFAVLGAVMMLLVALLKYWYPQR